MQNRHLFFETAKTQNSDIWSSALADAKSDPTKIDDIAENVSIAFSRLTIFPVDTRRVNIWGEHVAQETLKYNLEKYIFDGLQGHLRNVRPCKDCAGYQSNHCSSCSGKLWV